MSGVAMLVSAPIVWETRARGLDPQLLVAGLDLSLADVENPRGRMPWPDFVEFAGRSTKMLGSDTIEELAATATVESAPEPIRRVLPRLRDSRTLFLLASRFWGPWIFQGSRGRCERLPDGKLREVVRILPEYSACPEFLEGLRGTLRAMPRLLGQPDALVTLDHDGREGEFIITPPPPRERRLWIGGGRWFGRGQTMRPPVASTGRDLVELGFAREQLLESHMRVRSLTSRIDEQARYLDAVERLGLTLVGDNEVAREGREAEFAGFVREQLGVTGVRISHFERGGGPTREDVSGRLSGAPDRTLPLSMGDRRAGLLELWGVASTTSPALIDSILPWLTCAIEYRSSKSQVAHLTRLLSEDLRDWQAMERSVERIVAAQAEPIDEDRPRSWALRGDSGAFDLAEYLRGLPPRLRARFSDEIVLDLQAADELWVTHSEGLQFDSFVWEVLVTLGEIGSEQIRIQSRAVASRGRSGLDGTLAEIVISGRGGQLDAFSRRRLHTALERSDTGTLAPDLDVRTDAEGGVWVRVCLPLLGFEPTARIH